MSKKAGIFNFSLNAIFDEEQSILDRARITLLYYGLLIIMVALTLLLANVYVQHQTMMSYSAAFQLLCTIVIFKYLTYNPRWHSVSQAMLVVMTCSNLFDVYISLQDVNVVTIQT
ncbi:MAG: hypothetical protein ABIP28_05200, partial [Mucilaginibacter sp.]